MRACAVAACIAALLQPDAIAAPALLAAAACSWRWHALLELPAAPGAKARCRAARGPPAVRAVRPQVRAAGTPARRWQLATYVQRRGPGCVHAALLLTSRHATHEQTRAPLPPHAGLRFRRATVSAGWAGSCTLATFRTMARATWMCASRASASRTRSACRRRSHVSAEAAGEGWHAQACCFAEARSQAECAAWRAGPCCSVRRKRPVAGQHGLP